MTVSFNMKSFFILTLLLPLIHSTIAIAQNIVALQRIEGSIAIDGISDEEAWLSITPYPLTMNSPIFKGEPTEMTEIKIGYDDNYIYAAGKFYDSDPSGVRGYSYERDGSGPGDDHFAVILDTYNDNETALGFFTTPAGSRNEVAIFNDAETSGPPPWNSSWNTFWDVSVVKNEDGWFAEMRIPFSSLRFQDENGRIIMGLILFRYIARKNETVTYPVIPPKWDWGNFKPSVAQDISLEGIYSRKPLYVTPYGLGGIGHSHTLNDAETEYLLDDDPTNEIGIDLKYGITSNLTLDATVNTDFAQVEVDDEQINLTRFSLFFPEKRLFFLERSSIFDFTTGGPTSLFYSRSIGLTEDGDPVRIYGGARLVGRVGSWDLGAINMQTAKSDDLPSENFGILRFRSQVINENSFIGGMLTSRLNDKGNNNIAAGIDGVYRVFGDDYFSFSFAQSFDDTLKEAGISSLDKTGRLRTSWKRRTNIGFGYNLSYVWSASNYKPGVGFVTREDFKRFGNSIFYGKILNEKSLFYNYILRLNGELYLRNSDNVTESSNFGPELSVTFKSGAAAGIQYGRSYELLDEIFELSDSAFVPIGEYTFNTVGGFYQSPFGRKVRASFNANIGSFYDGTQRSFGIEPSWNVSPKLEIGGAYIFNRIRFDERNQKFDGNIIRIRVKATLNTKYSGNVFFQYNSETKQTSLNVRLRYNPKEGNDLYLVYSELFNDDNQFSKPIPPRSESQSLLIKYSYTFQGLNF
ncbi:MAG: carbohydrate binding family 9 domain-containing protein [Candidatus Marinimicrobia bacterium]|nr:carbohydrate binding family 9 domain-containing protein [Candidatus Neomarinimicrobiota bacterium]